MEQCQEISKQALNTSDIARSLANRTDNPNIQAQLLFMEGQYLFVDNQTDRKTYKFLSPSSVKEAFSNLPLSSGFLPANTIQWGMRDACEYLVQYIPPHQQALTLSNAGGDRLVTITIPIPGMLFMGWGLKYWLWSVKDKQLTPESQLFHAPLPNVMETGAICFGTTPFSPCSASNIVKTWDGFWHSPFNDHVVQSKSNKFPKDVRSQLLQLHGKEKKARTYPLSDLISFKQNVSSVIKSIIEAR
ncbi:hypothetical protein [Synechocystis sp. PCC 7509]|uniref:hypothetical protein n=1 Tax=Synechocystis sp. PCC 7509 TaxID=927677 RepID=UPI0002AC7128|nr:hypothetical protein [Synechocystis sp. PCC 7509]